MTDVLTIVVETKAGPSESQDTNTTPRTEAQPDAKTETSKGSKSGRKPASSRTAKGKASGPTHTIKKRDVKRDINYSDNATKKPKKAKQSKAPKKDKQPKAPSTASKGKKGRPIGKLNKRRAQN